MTRTFNSILLTFDVEDWFQVENLRPWNPPSTWAERELRVEKSTHRILDLLDSMASTVCPSGPTVPASGRSASDSSLSSNSRHSSHSSPSRHSIPATFFILGWIASRCPQLVKEIRSRGHEVASHGDSHLLCTDMDPDDLDQDLIQSKALLEDLIGEEVPGYRAPSFSVNETILDRIQSAGYRYDSSYNSFALHPRYGKMDMTKAGSSTGIAIQVQNVFWELPVSNLALGGKVIPWGGGGYFRLIPSVLFTLGVRKILHTGDAYVLYLHPWEFDPDQPRVKEVSWQFGFRHYVNLNKTESKLANLIRTFADCSFVSCSDYLRLQGGLG